MTNHHSLIIDVTDKPKSDYENLLDEIQSTIAFVVSEEKRLKLEAYFGIGASIIMYAESKQMDNNQQGKLIADIAINLNKNLRTIQRMVQVADKNRELTGQLEFIDVKALGLTANAGWSQVVKAIVKPREQEPGEPDDNSVVMVQLPSPTLQAIIDAVLLFQAPRTYRLMALQEKEKEIVRKAIKFIESLKEGTND